MLQCSECPADGSSSPQSSLTLQFSQHSPAAHCAPCLSMQVVALQQGLEHSCSDTTQHDTQQHNTTHDKLVSDWPTGRCLQLCDVQGLWSCCQCCGRSLNRFRSVCCYSQLTHAVEINTQLGGRVVLRLVSIVGSVIMKPLPSRGGTLRLRHWPSKLCNRRPSAVAVTGSCKFLANH